jgi:hypothetical protein
MYFRLINHLKVKLRVTFLFYLQDHVMLETYSYYYSENPV